jgi:hypothetical protein
MSIRIPDQTQDDDPIWDNNPSVKLFRGIGACLSTMTVEASRIASCRHRFCMDLRLRIGRGCEAAARGFAVSPSAAIKLTQPVRATGNAAAARYRGTVGRFSCPAELQTALQRRCRIQAGLPTIHNALRRIGLRHKKSP